MTNPQAKKLQLFASLFDFFNRNVNVYQEISHLNEHIVAFKVKHSRILVISQHHELIKKGIAESLPEIKSALCQFALGLAEILYLGSSKHPELENTIEKPLSLDELIKQPDKAIIEYSLGIYQTALKLPLLMEKRGIDEEIIETLKGAAEMYDILVPPPRTVILLSGHYENKIKKLIENLEETFQMEIDPLIFQFENRNANFYNEYQLIRHISQ